MTDDTSSPRCGAPRRSCPDDFEQMFVEIGWYECLHRYSTSHKQLNRWIDECGKDRLNKARKARKAQLGNNLLRPRPTDFDETFVSLGFRGCVRRYSAGGRTITRWIDEAGRNRLMKAREDDTRQTMSRVLKQAFPIKPAVGFTLARHAAHYLRINRNGGRIISPAPNGEWFVGTKRMSAAELLDLAVSKGFEPSNLTAASDDRVGSAR